MSRRTPPLLALETPFPNQNAMLRLLEPPDSCHDSLWERLFDGTYNKPFIIDSGVHRSLHFDLNAVQSEMHLGHPHRLSLAYTRKMMAFLLFNQAPSRLLLLGLGGGSLAKFCYRHLPRARITVIEVNPDVIALGGAFCVPADDERFRVMLGEGGAYLEQVDGSKDIILADACDRTGIAPELDTFEFYQNVHRCLSAGGVFVANMCSDADRSLAHLAKIRAIFGAEVMSLRAKPDGNVIVLAIKEPHPEIDWQSLEATAFRLKHRLRLNFPLFLRRIAFNWRARPARRLVARRTPLRR